LQVYIWHPTIFLERCHWKWATFPSWKRLDMGRNSNLTGPLPSTLLATTAALIPSLVVLDVSLTNILLYRGRHDHHILQSDDQWWADGKFGPTAEMRCPTRDCPCCAYCCNKTLGTCMSTDGGACSRIGFQLENEREEASLRNQEVRFVNVPNRATGSLLQRYFCYMSIIVLQCKWYNLCSHY
jgi:hypothetical protein